MDTTKNTQPNTLGRLLRLADVERLTGLRKSTIYAGMACKPPTFPTPVRISARAVAWRESDLMTWIQGRTEARPQTTQNKADT
jgi:prophage regulatory protein